MTIIELGIVWPPVGLVNFNCFDVPLLGTAVLLSSGVTVTWSHHSLIAGNLTQRYNSLIYTCVLGFYFLFIQYTEYSSAEFCFSDSVYGSIFFLLTGFHGFHVLVGVTFLVVCLFRLLIYHFSMSHFAGYEFAI